MVITIQVDNRVRISQYEIEVLGSLEGAIKRIGIHENPDYKKWNTFKKGVKPSNYIRTFEQTVEDVSLPRGRLSDLVRLLEGEGHTPKIEYNISDVPVEKKFVWKGPELWEAQNRLVDSFIGNLGIWRSVPGSGKTIATLYKVYQLQRRTLIVCPTEAVFKQWMERSREYLGTEPGVIQGSKRQIRDITIAMQQTLRNCAKDYAGEFGLVVVDEGQLAASYTYQETIDVFSSKYRLTVTGDERRADHKEFLIYDQFGSQVEEVTAEECYRAGTLVEVDIQIVESDFRYPSYVELSPEKARRVRGGPKERARALANHRFEIRKDLDEAMCQDNARNALIVSLARKCVGEDQHVVVLSTRREHCLTLDAMLSAFAPTVRFMGDDEDFEESRDRFAKGLVKCAVGTYKKIGVGFEACRELGRGVLAIPFSVSSKDGRMQMAQFTGRFARAAKGKTGARVYYIHDVNVFGDKPVKLLKSWYKNVTVRTLEGKILPVQAYLKERQKKENAAKSKDERDDSGDLFTRFGK